MAFIYPNTVAEPPFEHPATQSAVWGRAWGCDNDVGTLRMVMMQPPTEQMMNAEPRFGAAPENSVGDPDEGWYWDFGVCPPRQELPLGAMQAQHAQLVKTLENEGVTVVYPEAVSGGRFSCYTRDSVIAVPGGAIVTRLAAQQRQGEERWASAAVTSVGMPIIRTITGTGLMEGGSFAWLNPSTAAIGRSNCVNDEGIRQVREILSPQGIDLVIADLSMHEIHIDGSVLMIDVDLALVNPSLLPYSFLEELRSRQIRIVPLNDDDDPWIVNGLAISPGRILLPEGASDSTMAALEENNIQVITLPYDQMQLNGGCIHCSTCPLVRDKIG